MNYIGFDVSTNSTGICFIRPEKKPVLYSYTTYIKEDFDFENTDFIVKIRPQPKTTSQDFKRILNVRDNIFRDCREWFEETSGCYFENYAMHGVGRITMLVETTAIIKAKLYEIGKSVDGLFAPMTIKKNIWGKGNLGKQEIYDVARNGVMSEVLEDLETHGFGFKKSSCWVSDIIDAYGVAESGRRSENE